MTNIDIKYDSKQSYNINNQVYYTSSNFTTSCVTLLSKI